MAKQTKKSSFLASFDGHDEAVKQASNVVRQSITTDEEIIEAFELRPDESKVVKCRLSSASARVHDEKSKDKEGLPYVIIAYTVMDEAGKGLRLSKFLPCYNRESLEIDADAMEEVWREIQGLGIDTKGLGADALEQILEDLTSKRPTVMVRIYCSKVKSGPNRGKLRANISAQRVVTDAKEDEDDDQDETPAPAPAAKPAPKGKKAAVAKVEELAKDVVDEDDDDAPPFKKGVKVTLMLEDDDGEEVEETGTIISVDEDEETATVKVGKEVYEDVAWDDLEVVA